MGKKKKLEKIDPLRVFLQAAYFDYTARLLTQLAEARFARMAGPIPAPGVVETAIHVTGNLPPTIIPAGINAIFSVELFLKALLAQEKGGIIPPQIHTLSELFNALSLDARAGIGSRYTAHFRRDPVGEQVRDAGTEPASWELIPTLEKFDRVFLDVRYCYELDEDWEFNTLEPLRNALIEYALSINPDWRPRLEGLGSLPTLLYR